MTDTDSTLYKDNAPPPGTEVHYARSVDGTFVLRLETLEGETDGDLLVALMEYTQRVMRRRCAPPRLTVIRGGAAHVC